VARQFQAEFGFERAVNCHIPGRSYMPVGYGQLGCSGFVVADRDGCFVSRRTRAYLDYGDAAFAHVEELLRAQLGEAAAPGIGIGIGIGPPATRRDNSEGEAAEAERPGKWRRGQTFFSGRGIQNSLHDTIETIRIP